MNQTVAERFLYVLRKHKLIEQDDDQVLQNLENKFLISALAEELLPNRYVSFCEPIYDEYSYTRIIRQLAETTDGEWIPTNISEVYDEVASQEQEDANITVIEFDCFGQHFKWSINQYAYGSEICADFHSTLQGFATNHLKGTFVKMPVYDATDDFVYLPQEVANDFREIVLALSSDEIVHLTKRFFELETFGMMMLKEFCLQFDFKNINQVNANGELALNIAAQTMVDKKDSAGEVVRFLLERGARSTIPDSQGQTALEIAGNDERLAGMSAD
jgi:hypothetical protein